VYKNDIMNKFSKLFNVLLFSLGASAACYGKAVDEVTAKKIGANFLISNGVGKIQSSADLVTNYVATSTVAGVTVTDFYVYNFASGSGFIMVAADDRIEPVLAYSGEGSFDFNAISPDARWWIEGYQNQITYVIEHGEVAAEQEKAAQMWAGLQTVTAAKSGERTTSSFPSSSVHLLTTSWDQAPFYNYLCPVPGTSGTPTGCVATAMAQIMKYHSWPTVGTGYHSYTSTWGSYNLSADFGNTVYNWSGMPTSLTSNNVSVGTLMKHAGVSVNMNYTTTSSGSGAYTISLSSPIRYCAEYALKTFFHYKTTIRGLARSGGPGGSPGPISTVSWIATLKAEMDASRPVLYSGFGSGGGHAWVCDGYDGSNKMHFNWGWGGYGPNGYYTVDNIAPAVGIGGGSGNFNSDQDIIVGIAPQPYPATGTGSVKMLSHVDCQNNSPITYMGAFSVKGKILNSNSAPFTGDICAQAFDVNNTYEGTLQTYTGQTIAAGDSSALLTFSTSGMPGLIPGVNGIRIMYRPTGTTTWLPAADNGTFIDFNAIDVINSQGIELNDSLHVGSHVINRGSPLTISTDLSNIGSGSFVGTVQAVLINVATGVSYPVQALTGQSITLYSSKSFTFTNSGIMAPSGDYVLAIQHQPGGSGSVITTGSDYYQNPILFTIRSTTGIDEVKGLSDNVVVYPNPASNMINVALNGAVVDNIRVMDVQGRVIEEMPVDRQQLISIPVSNYTPGLYFVQLQNGTEVVTKKIVVAK